MELIIDALFDVTKLVPILFLVYVFVSFIEYRYGRKMGEVFGRFTPIGPFIGALFGCIPQCGFSVIAAALYSKRIISAGTLLSVFLSTSDEAVPILLSMPKEAHFVGILIFIKVIIAIVSGLLLDLLIKPSRLKIASPAVLSVAEHECLESLHEGCCSHGLGEKPSKFKALLAHPLSHTVKIAFFLFILSLLFNIIITKIGPENIRRLFLSGNVFQPFLTSFIGLIPNCFASVFLTGLFIKGVINFGALTAGLLSGAGLGILVLIKENKDRTDTIRIIAIMLGVSIVSGILIQLFMT